MPSNDPVPCSCPLCNGQMIRRTTRDSHMMLQRSQERIVAEKQVMGAVLTRTVLGVREAPHPLAGKQNQNSPTQRGTSSNC